MSPFPRPQHLQAAVSALRGGGVIACPTEAVWGLSCDPVDAGAVAHLLALKGRPVAKGLILVAGCISQVDFLLHDLPAQQRQLLAASWPGPITWLVPHRGRVPNWVCGQHASVAVRVSGHPVVSALCMAWGGPLVSTSANRAGARPALEAFQVRRYFGAGLDYLLPGRVGESARPTSIRDLVSGQIVRD
ncbi:MAG TPA: Sua5/YciO/YrdC/YwlC family protein [Halioglobus sp.]